MAKRNVHTLDGYQTPVFQAGAKITMNTPRKKPGIERGSASMNRISETCPQNITKSVAALNLTP